MVAVRPPSRRTGPTALTTSVLYDRYYYSTYFLFTGVITIRHFERLPCCRRFLQEVSDKDTFWRCKYDLRPRHYFIDGMYRRKYLSPGSAASCICCSASPASEPRSASMISAPERMSRRYPSSSCFLLIFSFRYALSTFRE